MVISLPTEGERMHADTGHTANCPRRSLQERREVEGPDTLEWGAIAFSALYF